MRPACIHVLTSLAVPTLGLAAGQPGLLSREFSYAQLGLRPLLPGNPPQEPFRP
jgi:hypothetical protein